MACHLLGQVIFYLSGLTCTDENFINKAGAQRLASELGIALVAPDTSPRGLNVEGESDNWDFGLSAGFYLNAKVEKWKNWRMYEYVVEELPALIQRSFPNLDLGNASIMGHSMGGHGALTIALKNPGMFKSISAFAPICNPTQVPWGHKAFGGYLGDDQSEWAQYDATELLKTYSGVSIPILMDTGTDDPFLEKQLTPWVLEKVAQEKQYPLTSRMQTGYNHSYFFIATFMADHIQFHAKALGL
ncbi:unnamed protein product [Ostreobium quekettii]|uniref:S-formylglutathione hydrolase n=1 Tax=Ostreobium quekettii TaxID=121088 RepID=A0A8S1INN1_9CHLO|nr:unnamed protein product [Ostreobium quekettii]